MFRTALVPALAFVAACAATPEPPAESATAPAAFATPPCNDPQHRDFDFWIGEWDVFNPDGTLAGTNSIQPAEYGCLLIERWVNTNGITGQSYNFLDPATDKWRQVWVSAGSVIDYSGKLNDNGAMRLEGQISFRNGTPPLPFRGEWTPNADGTVTQRFEQQNPETGEWSDWFVGTYVRRPAT